MTQLGYGYEGGKQYELYYRHSNRVPIGGLLNGGLAGVAVGAVIAAVYAYAIIYIPFIYVRFIGCLVFGFVLGGVPTWVMREFKVRSVPVVLAAVGVIALVAYYFHWAVWLYAVLNRHENQVEFLPILTNPAGMLRVIGLVLEKGTWGMSSHSDQVTGVFLGLIWLVEAAAIFGVAFVVARHVQTDVPFCESCNAWCGPGVKVRSMPWGDAEELKRRMENKDWAYFDMVGDRDESAGSWFAVIHHGCSFCNRLHTLSAKSYAVTIDGKGQTTVNEKYIVRKLLVTQEDIEFVCRPRGAVEADGLDATAAPTEEPTGEGVAPDENLSAGE
ncbi:MAG TPA: hypothetical protein VG269_23160 [Tepidisphaeraceae bacterium]|jgi:hypothetical protein|nr:hypothetical protein [Tepidisphaeraceae bacterium]